MSDGLFSAGIFDNLFPKSLPHSDFSKTTAYKHYKNQPI